MNQKNFLQDLKWINEQLNIKNSEFQNANVLIVGGSGFLGTWLLLYFDYLKQSTGINLDITAIRRQEKLHQIDELNDSRRITWIYSNVANLKLARRDFTHVFFCATPSQPQTGMSDDLLVTQSTIDGTSNLLQEFEKQKTKPRYINLSSGAIYSLANTMISPYSEEEFEKNSYTTSKNLYANVKFIAENLVNEYTAKGLINGCNLRIFSVSGPLLPLDAHFAFGNFINQSINSEEIRVNGNPETTRSYVYISELILWILMIALNKSINGAINLGGFVPHTMRELAMVFINQNSSLDLIMQNPLEIKSSYYPDVKKLQNVLNVDQQIKIEKQISMHLDWLKSK